MELISNFNGLELLFIVILAILLFGPERIPEIAAKAGSFLRSIRKISSELMSEWRDEAGLEEVAREGRNLSASLNQSVREMRETIISDTQNRNQEQKESGSSAPRPATSGAQKQSDLEDQLQALESQLKQLRSQLSEQESAAQEEKDGG